MSLIPRSYYLDDLFDDFFASNKNNGMRCDIYEKDGNYHIEMDIPGFEKNDISVESHNGYLTISASKEEETKDEQKNYIRRERKYGKYERSFYLGDIEAKEIEAEFKDGLLKIIIPKKIEENKKVIEIK